MKANSILTSFQVIPIASKTNDQVARAILDNARLVEMIKSKSEKGFQLLYDKYCDALFYRLVKYVRRTDVAEDLLQETFVKIWKHIDLYDSSKGTLYTWMLNIARNNAIDYLRSSTHRLQLLHVDIGLFSLHTDFSGSSNSYTSEIEFSDFKTKALHLEPKYAEVIDMIFFYGWTHEQTAKILNLPLGTIKTRARKGLRLLRILYGQ